jgi:glycosyltransferase involved in cell wall biosynthesis
MSVSDPLNGIFRLFSLFCMLEEGFIMTSTTQTNQLASQTNQLARIKILMFGAGLDVMGGITSVEKLVLENIPPNLQIHHVATFASTFAKGTAMHNIKVFLRAVTRLLQASWKNEVDILHIHFSVRGDTLRALILALIALVLHKPFILHAHGGAYKEFYAALPQIAQRIIFAIFSRCTHLIALSEGWRSYYLSTFQLKPHQITVLKNPVSFPLTIPDRRGREQVTFVFLGVIGRTSVAHDKGAFDLIKAFGTLPASDKAVARLVLAGNGDLETAQQMIEELNLTEYVQLRSWLDPIQRDQLLMEADVFILPSYYEGLPMSMLEAMAWGLPVIVTPVGAIPEIVTHGQQGLLVQPGNQVEIAQAMQELIGNEKMRISLGTTARNGVQCLSIENYMNSLEGRYISVFHQSEIL